MNARVGRKRVAPLMSAAGSCRAGASSWPTAVRRQTRWTTSSAGKAATSASTACDSSGPGAVAQDLGQRIGECPWLTELENVSLGHGVSLLRWRSGSFEHPHDTPPLPFMPPPTFANSSPSAAIPRWSSAHRGRLCHCARRRNHIQESSVTRATVKLAGCTRR